MASERQRLTPELEAHLDATSPVPSHIAARYEEHAEHPLAVMMSHPDLGRLLTALTVASGGRAAIEIGTFVGISAAWIAEGLRPDGKLDSLEVEEARARETERWLTAVGLGERVRIHAGPAADTLARLPAGTYDLCYVDADKASYPDYLVEAVRLVRPGGMIVADNMFGGGDVADPANAEPRVEGLRAYAAAAQDHSSLVTAILPIGDGVALSVRRGLAS